MHVLFMLLVAVSSLIPARALQADATVLHDAYLRLHPGIYRYLTPAQFENRSDELQHALSHDQSLGDAFLAFTRFTASIECGHSYPNFFNQPASVARAIFRGQNRVPFFFTWLGGQMIVTKNLSTDPRIVPGSEIERVNGVAAPAILAALLPLARADGSNDAKRVDELGVRGDDRYEAFDIYFPLVFPQRSPSMALDVRSPEGVRFHTTVPALGYEQRLASIPRALTLSDPNAPLWRFRMLDARTGYLRMPTWETFTSKWDWKADIAHIFRTLAAAHASKLIVDLRGNEGGTDVGNEIIAHLIAAPLQLDAYRRFVRYRSVPAALRPYLDTWDPSFFDWGSSAIPYDARFYRLTKYDDNANGDVIAPASPRFSGSLDVLVDASNSSATFQFDAVVQRDHLGVLIGTPTGGNQRGINGGAFFFIRLPNSHIEVDLPLIATFPQTSRPDAGLTPDILVRETPHTIERGDDPILDAARAKK